MAYLRIATYNVRGGVGLDGRRAPARQLEILRGTGADCIALQEFANHRAPDGGTLLEHWCDSLGMHARYATCFTRAGKAFGNAMLSRFPIIECVEHDMSVPGARPRVALELVVAAGSQHLHIICLHGAVRARPRALQRPMILRLAAERRGDVSIILGDFNEWRSWNPTFQALRKEFATGPPLPTFPAVAPVFTLDRIWVRPRELLMSSHVYSHAPAGVASDHLPVVATIALDGDRAIETAHPDVAG